MEPGMEPSREHGERSDAELVRAVARFEEAAMHELYRRHGRAVFGLACRLLGDTMRAEEILQDVFVRLWEHPERFEPGRGELRSFLLRQAHSRSIDRLRSDTARARREEGHEVERARFNPGDDSLEREVWELIRSETVKEALAALSAGEREAITLAYFGGYTYREVATMLREPEGTIKGRIRVGLHKLATRLESAGLGARS
jgi:RNA polymerase sigma-70 factor (ECF subfamily)